MLIKLVELLSFALFGCTVSMLVNSLLLRFSKSLGIRNKNDVEIRWSNQSKPSLGGVSFFIVFLFTSIAYSIVFDDVISIFKNIEFVGLFIAGSLAFTMGLADDAYNTKPFAKLLIQIISGLTLVFTNTTIELTHNYYIDAFITVIWVVTLMNSLNMLDNMDGITGTTVFFILLACICGSFIIFDINRNVWSILLIAMIGALIGFLIYNVHPSKLFMGDAGSQFIGLFVAFFSIKSLWNVGEVTHNPSWVGVLICLIVFTPAAVDSLTVTINRLKKRQSPMVGGKDHTTHHLVYAGYNDKQVWYIFMTVSFLSFILGIGMIYLCLIKILLPLFFFLFFFIVVFIYLYRNTLVYKPKEKK